MDEAGILNEEEILRRLAADDPTFVVRDQVTGATRPSSAAFKPDADGVSVYRATILAAEGLTAADIRTRQTNLVVGFLAADARAIGLRFRTDPWPPEDAGHPRGVAHALLVGLETLGKGERKRRQRELTMLVSMRFIPIS